jgi:hypothetical protein
MANARSLALNDEPFLLSTFSRWQMDQKRLKTLSALLLREAKALVASSDASALRVTDPVLDSGSPRAQTFGDDCAGDSDYQLWIRLLQLHCSAQRFIDQGEAARAGLQEQITEIENLLRSRANPRQGDGDGSRKSAVGIDSRQAAVAVDSAAGPIAT